MELLPVNRDVFERNLAAVATRAPRTAAAIRAACPREDVAIWRAPDGSPTGRLGAEVGGTMLASRRGPADEAKRLVGTLDLGRQAAVVVLGFGVGNHVVELCRRLGNQGVVLVYEPDVGLLRAVFERVDFSAWMLLSRVTIVTDAEDTAQIAAACSGLEGVIASGTVFLEHPASTNRLGEGAARFGANFATVLQAVRTNIVTTLVQVDTSVRNQLQNLRWYARCPGILDLKDAARGKACVVVSAGPSLRKTIDALAAPGVRDRVVIIAVQTVLKTLLARGIRPHYVTALDYHEISARFYEGLSAGDVEGVTLVVETKANPAILRAYPGRIRCVRDAILDEVLPPEHRREMGHVPPGATVAHLAYALGRFLGCDPVILTGQDLAFTDNQYYAPHAAIHGVWGSELSEFRTLEMLEWERIARMKNQLRRVPGPHGQTLYTDTQMHTYLVQFERDFQADAERGLRTIDATQGGALKAHTTTMDLDRAIEAFGSREPLRLPETPPDRPEGLWRVASKSLRSLRQDAGKVAMISRETGVLLSRMLECQLDASKINPLIEESHRNAERVAKLDLAYRLIQHVNQAGQLARIRADRALEHDNTLTPVERQQRQIERDLRNVTWLVDVAEHVGTMLDDAYHAVEHAKFVTRDVIPADAGEVNTGGTGRVAAVISVDADLNGRHRPRELSAMFLAGRPALHVLLERLDRCERVGEIVLLSPTPEPVRALLRGTPYESRVSIETADEGFFRARQDRVAAARAWSASCWRGAIAGLTIYDEAFHPALLAPVMERRRLDAAVLLHADWALADPALIDACIERHFERPEAHAITFSQAPPGLGACVISRACATEMAKGGLYASIGGVLGYIPAAAQVDPIAKGVSLPVPPHARDLAARCIPESPATRVWLADAVGEDAIGESLSVLAERIARHLDAEPTPTIVNVDLSHPSLSCSTDVAAAILALRVGDEPLSVTLGGEAFDTSDLPALVRSLKDGGSRVHVRTRLVAPTSHVDDLIAAGPDVLSVDLLATNRELYRQVTGRDEYEIARLNLDRVLDRRGEKGGFPTLWVVPRITRRSHVLGEIEHFYDGWLHDVGACVIDPPPKGDRLETLPLPEHARRRLMRSTASLPPGIVSEIGPAPVLAGTRAGEGAEAR